MNRLRIALYHGYELTGSGSNEYTRQVTQAMAELGCQVTVLCNDRAPERLDFVDEYYRFRGPDDPTIAHRRRNGSTRRVAVYVLPPGPVQPVYVADQDRPPEAKEFVELTSEELTGYHDLSVRSVFAALREERPDVVHANHLVWQPVVADAACAELGIPFYVVAHGSAIEYAVRRDERYRRAAEGPLQRAGGLVWIAPNVLGRVLDIYPQHRSSVRRRSHFAGVGTDLKLFRPAASSALTAAATTVAPAYPVGGRSPVHQERLRLVLDRGDVESLRSVGDSYDRSLPDENYETRLRSLPPDAELLIYLGALTWGKGPQSLIAAMPEILSRRPEAMLLLVGSGTLRETLHALLHSLEQRNERLFDEIVSRGRSLETHSEREPMEDLEAYASAPERRRLLFQNGARLSRQVYFLGQLDHDRVRRLLPACRLSVLPSIVAEASPLVFAESLACGVLPMAANHSGLKDGLDTIAGDLPPNVWRHLRVQPDMRRRVRSIAANASWLLGNTSPGEFQGSLRRVAELRYDWKAVARGLIGTASQIASRSRAASGQTASACRQAEVLWTAGRF